MLEDFDLVQTSADNVATAGVVDSECHLHLRTIADQTVGLDVPGGVVSTNNLGLTATILFLPLALELDTGQVGVVRRLSALGHGLGTLEQVHVLVVEVHVDGGLTANVSQCIVVASQVAVVLEYFRPICKATELNKSSCHFHSFQGSLRRLAGLSCCPRTYLKLCYSTYTTNLLFFPRCGHGLLQDS